jgi:hypothetical protein
MPTYCPACGVELLPNNNKNSITNCASCFATFEVNMLNTISDADINNPPKGTWYFKDIMGGELGASRRSIIAYILAPFVIFWVSTVSFVFYGFSFFTTKLSVSEILFTIPFIISTAVLLFTNLYLLFGKVVITFNSTGGTVFNGFGKLGISKTFTWANYTHVKKAYGYSKNGSSNASHLILAGKRNLNIGYLLPEDKIDYFINVLSYLLKKYNKK